VQNAALRRVGPVKVHTTYITGMLTSAAEEGVQFLFWLRGRSRTHPGRLGLLLRLASRQETFRGALLRLGLWLAYVAGAVAGAFAHLRLGLACLVVPLAVLAGIIGRDLHSSSRTRGPPQVRV
jgi:uncharacterized membrane protein YoaK (UPF0700 family)